MNSVKKLPVLYSFGFLKQFNGLIDGPTKNMFQYKIHHAFAKFIKENIETLLAQCEFNEETKKHFQGLLLENIGFGDFSSFRGTHGDESIYINFVVPEQNHSLQNYLKKQAEDLKLFFRFLRSSSYVFAENDAGKKWRKVSIGDQPVLPVFVEGEGGYNLSFEVQGELRKKLQCLLLFANQSVVNEVTEAIHSILSYDPSLHKHTRVVLHENYVGIQIFGNQCSLIGVFSEENSMLMAKHIDCAPQMIALLAAVGCLLHLVETRK